MPQIVDFKDMQAEDQAKLQHISDLLHLCHHRNKNQHRRSIWWRQFSTFRRQLNSFMADLVALNKIPETHLARTKKKTLDRETQTRMEERLAFWRDVEVRKWQQAFSQLVADIQFASLGLVLLAALAEVCKIVGVTASFEDMPEVEAEEVFDDFSQGLGEASSQHFIAHATDQEDLGEAIARDTDQDGNNIKTAADTPVARTDAIRTETEVRIKPQLPLQSAARSEAPKKKRKKGNAIDDLFSSLD